MSEERKEGRARIGLAAAFILLSRQIYWCQEAQGVYFDQGQTFNYALEKVVRYTSRPVR
jgi:hypothetical protein